MATHYLARAYHTVGDYPQAMDCSQQIFLSLQGDLIRERFGLSGPLSTLARAVLVRCLADVGEFIEGRTQGEETIRIAEAIGQPFAIMDACNAVGGLYVHQGELHRAIPILERSFELCQVWHILLGIPRTASFLGMAYALSGRVAEALPLLEEAVEGALSKNIRRDHPLWVTHLSQAYLLAGRIGDAIPLAWRALKISQVHKERGHQAYALRLLGEIAARREPPDSAQAEAHYRQALALADALGMRPLQAHCHRSLGMLYAKLGQQEHARSVLSTAIDLYRAMEMTFWLPQTEAAMAEVERRA
jgi:tetratricopeptide (TPR) repeat protein